MARLIDADIFLKTTRFREGRYPCKDIVEDIESQPIVDAVPVVHGRWIDDYDTFIQDNGYESEPIHTGFVCSVCGRHSFAIEPYCHCGAKMDLEVP